MDTVSNCSSQSYITQCFDFENEDGGIDNIPYLEKFIIRQDYDETTTERIRQLEQAIVELKERMDIIEQKLK